MSELRTTIDSDVLNAAPAPSLVTKQPLRLLTFSEEPAAHEVEDEFGAHGLGFPA